jgi:hypothetical protein
MPVSLTPEAPDEVPAEESPKPEVDVEIEESDVLSVTAIDSEYVGSADKGAGLH